MGPTSRRRTRAKLEALFAASVMACGAASACNEILGNSDGRFIPDAGASSDAGNDVARADGAVTGADAGDDTGGGTTVDDGGSEDAAVNGFCAKLSPTPAFCADFDEPMSDGGLYGFASEVPGSGCSLTRDTTNESSPLALHAKTTNTAGCFLSATVVPTMSIAIDLDLRVHSLPNSPGGVDALFALHAGNAKYTLYATKGSMFLQGANGAQQSNSDMLPGPPIDAYKHVQMKLVLTAGSNPMISGRYDQTTITFGGKPQVTTQGPFEPKTMTDVRIGLPEVVFSNVGDVYIDNVVVTVQ